MAREGGFFALINRLEMTPTSPGVAMQKEASAGAEGTEGDRTGSTEIPRARAASDGSVTNKDEAKELLNKEEIAEGGVSAGAYLYFIKCTGYVLFFFTALFNIVGSTGVVGVVSGFILSTWTDNVAQGKKDGMSDAELRALSLDFMGYCTLTHCSLTHCALR